MNYHRLWWVQHILTKSFWFFVNIKNSKENNSTIICVILNHPRENFVMEIKQISWSCPDPTFFTNKYLNPILIQKVASILQDIQSWSCRCSPVVYSSDEHDPVPRSRSNRILQFRTGSRLDCILKKLNRIRYGCPNCIDHCSIMLNQSLFFGYEPDWTKHLDRSTGLGSDYSMKILDWIMITKISNLFNTSVRQCWTWSGFRITIQPDSAIQGRIRIRLDFEKNYRIGYGYPNWVDHCSRMLNQSFFRI